MNTFDRKQHWENIYQNKEMKEFSWYQSKPETSLNFLNDFNLPKTAKIIDVGGGDGFLVDSLLDLGYQDLTVLDISAHAIERAKKRLGDRGKKVKWLISDATNFKPNEKYDFWHDRAVFHFLKDEKDVSSYLKTAKESLNPNAFLLMGTFSEEGPVKCSGIEIKQYTEEALTNLFTDSFKKLNCIRLDHKTPFDTLQNFLFCSFQKI